MKRMISFVLVLTVLMAVGVTTAFAQGSRAEECIQEIPCKDVPVCETSGGFSDENQDGVGDYQRNRCPDCGTSRDAKGVCGNCQVSLEEKREDVCDSPVDLCPNCEYPRNETGICENCHFFADEDQDTICDNSQKTEVPRNTHHKNTKGHHGKGHH